MVETKKMVFKSSLTSSSNKANPVQDIANLLFEAEIVTHITHLQAKNKSYAEHIALGEFYEAIGELNDSLIEKSYVDYGIINNYNITVNNSTLIDCCTYLRNLRTKVMEKREQISIGFIEQMVDNIIEQISHTIYKLDNLK